MIRWHLTDELAAVWPTDDDPIAAWLAAGVAEIVKRSPQRTVYRVRLPGRVVYVKQHHLPDGVTWLRQCLRAPKASFEFERMRELERRGVPAPVPLGWGSRTGVLGIGESFLVTAALDDVVSLYEFRPRERRTAAVALGRFVARMHDCGILHRDLHAGNFLVRPNGELFLVDLDAVRIGAPLDEPDSLANLAMLAAGFACRSSRSDRYRFLAAYAWARGWDSHRRLHPLAAEIESRADVYNHNFWRHRDQRCLRPNRYFRPLSGPATTGHALRGIDPAWLDAFVRDPDAVFASAPLLKNSRSSTVASTWVEVAGTPLPIIVKRFRVTNRTDPWTALVRPTAALRSWLLGHGLLERDLPTARPLVVLQRRQAGLVREGYLVTEKIEPAQDLHAYVRDLAGLPATQARRRLLRQLERVALAVRELHRRRLSHRDLKAANLLVTTVAAEETPAGAPRPFGTLSVVPIAKATTNLWFIDLVGVRLHDRLGRRRRVQNLARLNASFLTEPAISRSDRLRFLRIYLAWGIHGKNDWKTWWRQIAAATAAKVERNRRSGRALT